MTKPDCKRFHINSTFVEQFCHTYNSRLKNTREALTRNSRDRWGEELKNVPIEQLSAELGNTEVFVIGTLFKLMPKQPSILRELEDNERYPTDPNVNFTCDEDQLILHETDENVRIVGDIDVHMHVTGIPISLKGYQLDGGAKFHVLDFCYAGPNLSVYRMPEANGYHEKTREVLLIVSGLEFGFDSSLSDVESTKIINALRNLKGFIHGDTIGTEGGSIVKRVIIAGNSVAPGFTKDKLDLLGASEARDNRSLNTVFRLVDRYVAALSREHVEIELMPGKNDPASFLLPQQPFHPRILRDSSQHKNVHPNTNPCIIQHDELTILGTSGENVESIRQYSRIEFSTTALKNTLEWGHVAPLAPDNLSCVPFKDYDPFVIDFVPDIYFAGNQQEFAVTTYSTEVKKKIQIISVPKFVSTLSGVVVNLKNLDVELRSFK